MNSYWKIKQCLSNRKKDNELVIRMYPEWETYPEKEFGYGYWNRRIQQHGMPKKLIWELTKRSN